MKKFLKGLGQFLIGLLFVAVVAVMSAAYFDVSLTATGGITMGLAVLQTIVAPWMPNAMFVGVLQELWTGELINKFRHEGSFMSRIPSANQYVNNDVIHLADIGADPEVLINNTTYPIGVVSRTDSDVTISLDKYDTTNTKITDDELYALPYDKEGSVIRQHRETLEDTTIEKSLHALAPATNTTNGPVLETTGATNGETNARKKCVPADVAKLQRRYNDAKIPKRDRILVLCNQHLEDLLGASENFNNQYQLNSKEGKVTKLYGFEIYEENYNPVYQSGTKQAFAQAAAPTLDQNASVAFYAGRCVKATGTVKMYQAKAEDNPTTRESIIGFRMRHIAFPKTLDGFGAIISAVV